MRVTSPLTLAGSYIKSRFKYGPTKPNKSVISNLSGKSSLRVCSPLAIGPGSYRPTAPLSSVEDAKGSGACLCFSSGCFLTSFAGIPFFFSCSTAKRISLSRPADATTTTESLWMSIIALAAAPSSGGLEKLPIDILRTTAAICSLEGKFSAAEAGRIACITNGSCESTRLKIALALISSSGWAVTKSAVVPGRCETVPISI